jgi:hypothetical protein
MLLLLPRHCASQPAHLAIRLLTARAHPLCLCASRTRAHGSKPAAFTHTPGNGRGTLVPLSSNLASCAVQGHLKTVIILTGGCLLFGDTMPAKKLLGVCIAMAGACRAVPACHVQRATDAARRGASGLRDADGGAQRRLSRTPLTIVMRPGIDAVCACACASCVCLHMCLAAGIVWYTQQKMSGSAPGAAAGEPAPAPPLLPISASPPPGGMTVKSVYTAHGAARSRIGATAAAAGVANSPRAGVGNGHMHRP